jgi:hypothetical protein
MFFTVKNVGDPLSDRMIRLEEQNRYIISQQNEIKAAAVDYVAEEVRMELKIRTTVKPECLR